MAGRTDLDWPDLILVPYEWCIWKVRWVRTWRDGDVRLKDFHSDLIDVQMFGLVWVYGPPFSFRASIEWVAPHLISPLNEMEILALCACDDFPMEKALDL